MQAKLPIPLSSCFSCVLHLCSVIFSTRKCPVQSRLREGVSLLPVFKSWRVTVVVVRDSTLPLLSVVAELTTDSHLIVTLLSRAGCCACSDPVHTATGVLSSRKFQSNCIRMVERLVLKIQVRISVVSYQIRQWFIFVGEKRKRLVIGNNI